MFRKLATCFNNQRFSAWLVSVQGNIAFCDLHSPEATLFPHNPYPTQAFASCQTDAGGDTSNSSAHKSGNCQQRFWRAMNVIFATGCADYRNKNPVIPHKENTMKMQQGFTLVELMIAAIVVGILAAIAIPNYQNYVVKGNRAAAQAFMVDAANREKQYLLDARAYLNVANNAAFTNLGMTVPADVSKHYAVSIVAVATPPSFTITADPAASPSAKQVADGAITLSSDGTKLPADKW